MAGLNWDPHDLSGAWSVSRRYSRKRHLVILIVMLLLLVLGIALTLGQEHVPTRNRPRLWGVAALAAAVSTTLVAVAGNLLQRTHASRTSQGVGLGVVGLGTLIVTLVERTSAQTQVIFAGCLFGVIAGALFWPMFRRMEQENRRPPEV